MAINSDIDFGVTLGTLHNPTQGFSHAYTEMATTAEQMGFDAIFEGDHLTFPVDMPGVYPFSSGTIPFESTDPTLELFGALGFIAASTSDITIGSRVTVVPYRHPVLLAKAALTLDELSEGRFELGVGCGWLQEEFEVLDIPFEERGSRTDEFLRLFEQVCSQGEVAFEGEHHTFPPTGFYPRPVQDQGTPIMVGGHSGATFRRVAEFGDGWTISYLTPDEIRSSKGRLKTAWEDYDRSGEPIVSLKVPFHFGEMQGPRDKQIPEDIPTLTGDPETVIEKIEEYADSGVDRIVIVSLADNLNEKLDQLRIFGAEVVAPFN